MFIRCRRNALAFTVLAVLLACLSASQTKAQVASAGSVQAFKMVGDRSGWLLANGRLFWTDSVGASWSEISPARKDTPLVAGAFFSAEGKGVAVLASAESTSLKVARTTDKGQHWTYTAVASPFTEGAEFNGKATPYFSDEQHGWIMLGIVSSSAFRRGILLKTVDGGLHWTQAPTPPVGGEIVFTDAAHGWTGPGPAGDELFSTADAGQSWHAAVLPPPSDGLAHTSSTITLPVFTDASHGSLVRTYLTDAGQRAVLYQTQDGGATWQPAAQPVTRAFATLAADGSLIARNTQSLALTDAVSGTLTAVESSFSTASNGLVFFAGGTCDQASRVCSQTKALRGTLDGGKTFFSVRTIRGLELETTTRTVAPVKAHPPTSSEPATPGPQSSYPIVDVMGFDACTPPTVAQMQTWITSSPYQTAGIYIGGNEFACSSTLSNVTSSYVASVLGQGWEIVPIWVGPQAPGAGFTFSISTDPATATAQGTTEADSAAAAMAALGMGQGSTVVYDMEAYTYTNATYAAATTAFLDGWDSELHAKGYLAAVYSGHNEFLNWLPGMVTPAIDTIWFTYFFSTGVPCGTTCDTVYPTGVTAFVPLQPYWLNHHRSRQTSSAFNSSYGGLTLNIDEDYTDAAFEVATPITLTVAKTGSGTGTAATATINNSLDTSTDTAISCGPTCTTASANFATTDTVTLTASPATGSTFVSWTGCTSVSGSTCTVATTAASTVTVNFTASTYALTVTDAGTGSGTVTSGDGKISCGTSCSASYAAGTAVTLTATPATGSVFGSWTGCTTTSGTTCQVTTGAAAESITATFNPAPPTYALTVAKAGTGTGTVASGDGKISCGTACSASYAAGTAVTLTATPATGSVFGSWAGCTTTSGTTCQVTTGSAAATVTATFNPAPPTYALTVAKAGTGTGTVSSADGFISCGTTCSSSYLAGTPVTLTATPATGSVFGSWTGCTTTSGATCQITTGSAAATVTATFNPAPTFSAALSATTLSIVGGNSATTTLTISPQTSYVGSFTSFACTGLPASATCSFSPTSLVAAGDGAKLATTLTITTTAVSAVREPFALALGGLLLPAMLLPWLTRRRKGLHRLALGVFVLALAAVGTQLVGCGGGSSASPTPTGNAPFSGTINVTFTSASGTQSLPLTLNVTAK